MRQTAFFFLLLFIQTGVSAQATDYRKQQNYKEWVPGWTIWNGVISMQLLFGKRSGKITV